MPIILKLVESPFRRPGEITQSNFDLTQLSEKWRKPFKLEKYEGILPSSETASKTSRDRIYRQVVQVGVDLGINNTCDLKSKNHCKLACRKAKSWSYSSSEALVVKTRNQVKAVKVCEDLI